MNLIIKLVFRIELRIQSITITIINVKRKKQFL